MTSFCNDVVTFIEVTTSGVFEILLDVYFSKTDFNREGR